MAQGLWQVPKPKVSIPDFPYSSIPCQNFFSLLFLRPVDAPARRPSSKLDLGERPEPALFIRKVHANNVRRRFTYPIFKVSDRRIAIPHPCPLFTRLARFFLSPSNPFVAHPLDQFRLFIFAIRGKYRRGQSG